MGDAPSGEHLLDGAAPGDELLIGAEDIGWHERGRLGPRRPVGGRPERGSRARWTGWTGWTGLARPVRAGTVRAWSVGPSIGRAVTRTSGSRRSWREASRSLRSPIPGPIVGASPAVAGRTGATVWRARPVASVGSHVTGAAVPRTWAAILRWAVAERAIVGSPPGSARRRTGTVRQIGTPSAGAERRPRARPLVAGSRARPLLVGSRPRSRSPTGRAARLAPAAGRAPALPGLVLRSISHDRPRPSDASAGRRGCPRR
jgi:hypothetical protein